ncbi:hypothetical protein [Peribacillus frigoritolerans]|uniref:hypothetical protein n=1 Tax=Peribacillus frigoritolerans TaxID=450367 RepID=UPI00207A9343|nr:hypothetical protein [Peribacillus frigoritolerans]USK63793.1 hypothetical protein LIT26_21675 [Peribacillus frigoritolerans]
MFFPVLLNGWKKYATLLPNRRLGRQSAERERISEINWNFKKKKLQAGLITNHV